MLDVLFGNKTNPSGNFLIRWPREYEHTGCLEILEQGSFESGEIEYAEGINMGYRHFDKLFGTEKEAIFPFVFRLSYT